MSWPVRPGPKFLQNFWDEGDPTIIPKPPWKGFGNLRFSYPASGPFCWHTVLKLPFQTPFSPILDTCLSQSLAEEDAHKNMNLINDTKIVFLQTAKAVHSFFFLNDSSKNLRFTGVEKKLNLSYFLSFIHIW